MSDFKNDNIKCPFFKAKNGKLLKCEGVLSKTCTHNFRSASQREKTEKEFCSSNYTSCPFYKILNAKYPE